MLISESQREEGYISYFHKPIVQGWTTPSSSWRRWKSRWRRWRPRRQRPAGVFPLQLQSRSLFHVFCVSTTLPSERRWETIFIVVFRSRRGSEKKIDGIGGSSPRIVGPMRPRNLAAWAHLSWPSGLRLFAFFTPMLRSL